MTIRAADAHLQRNLAHSFGHMRLGSGTFDGSYDLCSGIREGKEADPEELLGAAHAEFTVKSIHTKAKVDFDEREGGWSIRRIDLGTNASVLPVAKAAFEKHVRNVKNYYPIPQAYPESTSSYWPSTSQFSALIGDAIAPPVAFLILSHKPAVTTG